MLVTFESRSYADITMFGDVAVHLLHLMGHSGTVPGAIQAEEIPESLVRLKTAIEQAKAENRLEPQTEGDEDEDKVSLAHRALPLIQLLEAAIAAKSDVMWHA
ncbi:MAG: DUF1840 domain-containing protein [Chromatiales bacterium]|jgi:hypothetical protein